MKISSNPENKFVTDFSMYEVIGFHGTTELACQLIEDKGFLPDKVFPELVHDDIRGAARLLDINTSDYDQWLEMRSVTFAQEAAAAINHITTGNAGGQGLKNMAIVLEGVLRHGDDRQKSLACKHVEQIERIRQANAVVYAVNLSGLGQRLVKDPYQPFYQFYWNPNLPLPALSEIGSSRLIERLSIHR